VNDRDGVGDEEDRRRNQQPLVRLILPASQAYIAHPGRISQREARVHTTLRSCVPGRPFIAGCRLDCQPWPAGGLFACLRASRAAHSSRLPRKRDPLVGTAGAATPGRPAARSADDRPGRCRPPSVRRAWWMLESRDPRRDECTIWAAVAPEEVLTVRTYGDTPDSLKPRLVRRSRPTQKQTPSSHPCTRSEGQEDVTSQGYHVAPAHHLTAQCERA
jgi:hypothetical protein